MSKLRMVWKNKDPETCTLKDGCYVINRSSDRFTKEQLADGWIDACIELTGGVPWTREQFFDKMWNDPTIPEDGMFFAVTSEGRIFSTASVQLLPNHAGNLHMVGSSSDVRGMGGGRAVCTAVIQYLKQHEIELAYLYTDDFRKPAIKIYLGIGYRPYLSEDGMVDSWYEIMDYFGIDQLEAYDRDLNDIVLYSKVESDKSS